MQMEKIELKLYMVQRLTAMFMVPFILIHLGIIIYATRDGISAAEILGRTKGSIGWMLFYGLFVIAAAIHGTIGIRNIVSEAFSWRGRSLEFAMAAVVVLLIAIGLRAVGAVT